MALPPRSAAILRMEYVEIPATVTLEAMMKELYLPCPRYKTKTIAYGNYETEVQFYPSLHSLQTSPGPHLLLGYPKETLEAAVDNAARRVIRYMETVEKKVPKETQHQVLEKEKKKNKALLRKLRCVGEKIIKKTNQVRKIMDASDAYIEKVCIATDQIQKIGSDSSSSNCRRQSHKYAAVLLQLRAVAADLAQDSVEIIGKFKANGIYPYGKEKSESADSSESSGSALNHRDFDSDGCRSCDA